MTFRITVLIMLVLSSLPCYSQKKYGQEDYDRICVRYTNEITRLSSKLRTMYDEIEAQRIHLREIAGLEKKWSNEIKNAKQAKAPVPILKYGEIELVRPFLVDLLLPNNGWRELRRNGKLVVYMNRELYENARKSNVDDLKSRIEDAIKKKMSEETQEKTVGNTQNERVKTSKSGAICNKLEKDIDAYNKKRQELTKRINDATAMLQRGASDKTLKYGSPQQQLQDTLSEILIKKEIPKEVAPMTDKECKTCEELKNKTNLLESLEIK